jgi:hypothetical protein
VFRRKVTAHDKVSIRIANFERVDNDTYEGSFISQAGKSFEFAWDREVGFMWLHDATLSYLPEDGLWKSASKSMQEYVDEYETSEQIMRSISSVESIAIPAKRKLARGTRREFGVSRSSGFTTYFSLDQTRFLAYYKRDNGAINQSPEQINKQIVERRAARDDRKFIAIVEGQVGTLEYYRDRLTEPDYVIYVSDNETLASMGIKAVDANWSKGDRQIDLNQIIARRIARVEERKKQRRALNFMEENQIFEDNSDPDTDDRLTEEVIEGVQDFVMKKAPSEDIDKMIGLPPTHDTIVEVETTELVDVVKRQNTVGARTADFEQEADFEKYSDPDEVIEDEVIAKEAIRFLSGDEIEDEETSVEEFKIGQRVKDSMTGDYGRIIRVEGNKLHVQFEDSDEVSVLPTFMVE